MVGIAVLAGLAGIGAAAAEPAAAIACEVSGYEVILRNPGTTALPPGTVVRWEVPFARKSGQVALESALGPGEMLFLSAALGSSFLAPDVPCTASLA